MRRGLGALLSAVLILAPAGVRAEEEVQRGMFPYRGEGHFVNVPAMVVSSPVMQVGTIAGAMLCLPFSLAKDARGEGDQMGQPSLVCGRKLALGLGWPVYVAGGLPFYILKKAFWDGPRALGRSLRGAKPEPAPAAR